MNCLFSSYEKYVNVNCTLKRTLQSLQRARLLHNSFLVLKRNACNEIFFFIYLIFSLSLGIEVVKEGIRKLRFSQQLRKSETGAKTRKVELTISVDGVAIQEPRSHLILHQFPLHRISYCADDKGEKKFFSFIAKQPNQGKVKVSKLYY